MTFLGAAAVCLIVWAVLFVGFHVTIWFIHLIILAAAILAIVAVFQRLGSGPGPNPRY